MCRTASSYRPRHGQRRPRDGGPRAGASTSRLSGHERRRLGEPRRIPEGPDLPLRLVARPRASVESVERRGAEKERLERRHGLSPDAREVVRALARCTVGGQGPGMAVARAMERRTSDSRRSRARIPWNRPATSQERHPFLPRSARDGNRTASLETPAVYVLMNEPTINGCGFSSVACAAGNYGLPVVRVPSWQRGRRRRGRAGHLRRLRAWRVQRAEVREGHRAP